MSDEILTFIRAQLDEDERVAKAPRGRWVHEVLPDPSGPDHVLHLGDRIVSVGHFEDDPLRPAEAEHIIRHDPARVLAEVDAKRQTLDRHTPFLPGSGWTRVVNGVRVPDLRCARCWVDEYPEDYDSGPVPLEWPCPEIRGAALPYAGREGYRESWRP